MTKLKLNILGTEVEYKGNEIFLETKVLKLLEGFKKSYNGEVKRNLLEVHENLQQNLATMAGYSASMSRLVEELDSGIKEIHEKSANFLESIEVCWSSESQTLLWLLYPSTSDSYRTRFRRPRCSPNRKNLGSRFRRAGKAA